VRPPVAVACAATALGDSEHAGEASARKLSMMPTRLADSMTSS